MKKAILFFALLWLGFCGIATADMVTLQSGETIISDPTAQHLEWYVSRIDANKKLLIVHYRWTNADGSSAAYVGRTPWKQWTCRDIEVPGSNDECVGAGDPYPCCTGEGTGTCDDMQDTCFSDIFLFQVRSQDVGTAIGKGLRTLIWNKFKQDVLSQGNEGTFEE